MTSPEIVSALQKLVAEGKTPNLALLKARLTTPLPMPVLIQALKQFRQDPDSMLQQQTAPAAAQATPPSADQPDMQLLLDEIRALRSEVASLRAELKARS